MQGPAGNTGPKGEPGKDAAGGGYRPEFAVGCERAMDLIASGGLASDGVSETYIGYSWTQFSNGDVDVSCTASLGSAESGADGTYFPGVTEGATLGACTISIDYPPYPEGISVAGHWRFETASAGPAAKYVDADPGHPMNGRVFAFTENDCGVFRADANGVWQDAALSDAF